MNGFFQEETLKPSPVSHQSRVYVEEENRGFVAEENHAIPGVFEVDIEPYEEKEISIICSLEENIDEKNAKEIIEDEKRRLNKLIKNSLLIENKKITEEDDFKKQMLIASDNFVAYRPMYRSHTILAGYPWFLDWSRDTLISFEGLLLLTKRFKIAREVLLTCVRDIKFGLIPNHYITVWMRLYYYSNKSRNI